jgi:cytochrome c oxidase cbb3-type subunit I
MPAPEPAVALPGSATAPAHALGWLVVANAVGLWVSLTLAWPTLGNLAAPLTYGRWVPVHLNGQLYGWTAIPLVALLLRVYWPGGGHQCMPRLAVTAWSGALAFACADWLLGGSGGKLFMDWAGTSRVLFPLALLILSICLAAGYLRHRQDWTMTGRVLRVILWLVLLPVPFLMAWAASPSLFPPVNPDSGGATGSSLLGSTLALVIIFWMAPALMGAERTRPTGRVERAGPWLLAVHFAAYLLGLEHGDASHHQPVQVWALFTLWFWPPLLAVRMRAFAWPAPARRWLLSFGAWGTLLTFTACLMFLPGALDRLKFTNAFVAHTHLAMAGMLTSFNLLLLLRLHPGLGDTLGRRGPFLVWHGGLLLHLGTLFTAGWIEAREPAAAFSAHGGIHALYVLRSLAGALMLAASVLWLRLPRALPARGPQPEIL